MFPIFDPKTPEFHLLMTTLVAACGFILSLFGYQMASDSSAADTGLAAIINSIVKSVDGGSSEGEPSTQVEKIIGSSNPKNGGEANNNTNTDVTAPSYGSSSAGSSTAESKKTLG